MTLGNDLRQAREQRGLSIHDIAKRTTIRVSVVRAIENDDFQHVPGSVIMRGFLKLYAREVELDPADVGRRYTDQSEWVQPAALPDRGAALPPHAAVDTRRRFGGVPLIATAAILVALLAAGCPAWLMQR